MSTVKSAEEDGGNRAALSAEEKRVRILCAISDFGSMQPEDDEDWESWYVAAFSMLGERVRRILNAPDDHPTPNLGQPSDSCRRLLQAAEVLFAPYCKDATAWNWLDEVRAVLAAHGAAAAAPSQDAEAAVLLRVIQRLNHVPYSLTKAECISEVQIMRDVALARAAQAQGGNHG